MKNNDPKVALCISGLPRCFEQTYKNNLKYLIEPNNCDIFIYTSDFINQRRNLEPRLEPIEGSIFYTRNENKITDINYRVNKELLEKKLVSLYNDRIKQIFIEEETRKNNEDVGLNSCRIADPKQRKPWTWIKKTFEKTYKCQKLLENYCSKNNIKYDIVIRSRMDISFKKQINVFQYDFKNSIYAFGGWNPGGAHAAGGYNKYYFDGFAFSSFENMKKYSLFYEQEKENLSIASGQEPQLDYYLSQINLQYKPIFKTDNKRNRNYIIER